MTETNAFVDLRQDVLRSLADPNRWSRDVQRKMHVVAQDIAQNAMMDSRGSLSSTMRRNFRKGMIDRTQEERDRLHGILSHAAPLDAVLDAAVAPSFTKTELARHAGYLQRHDGAFVGTFAEGGVVVLLAPMGDEIHCHAFQRIDDLVSASMCTLILTRDGAIHRSVSVMHKRLEGRIGKALSSQVNLKDSLDAAARFAMPYALAVLESAGETTAPPVPSDTAQQPPPSVANAHAPGDTASWLASLAKRIGWKRFGLPV